MQIVFSSVEPNSRLKHSYSSEPAPNINGGCISYIGLIFSFKNVWIHIPYNISHKASIKKQLSDLLNSWRAPLIGTLVTLLCIQPSNYDDVMIYMWWWKLFHMKCSSYFVHLLCCFLYLHSLIPAQCWHSTKTMRIRSKLKLSWIIH